MKIFFDGSGWNGRESKYCVVFEDSRSPILKRFSEKKTNNEMEYAGLLEALIQAKSGDAIFTDSQLIEGQVIKGWKVKAKHLQSLAKKAQSALLEKNATLTWIPREKNKAGHALEGHAKRPY